MNPSYHFFLHHTAVTPKYLLDQCLRKKLQIVICTHSASLIEGLPPDWIKVFRRNNAGKFDVINRSTPLEAFHFLGETPPESRAVHVEDKLAKQVLDEMGKQLFPEVPLPYEVYYSPGGKDQLKKDAELYSRRHQNREFIVFDWDVRPVKGFEEPDSIAAAVFSDPVKSVKELKERLGDFNFIKVPRDSNSPAFQERDGYVNYTRFLINRVFFFPFDLEEMIWSPEFGKKIHEDFSVEMDFSMISALKPKLRYVELARPLAEDQRSPSSAEISKLHGCDRQIM